MKTAKNFSITQEVQSTYPLQQKVCSTYDKSLNLLTREQIFQNTLYKVERDLHWQ